MKGYLMKKYQNYVYFYFQYPKWPAFARIFWYLTFSGGYFYFLSPFWQLHFDEFFSFLMSTYWKLGSMLKLWVILRIYELRDVEDLQKGHCKQKISSLHPKDPNRSPLLLILTTVHCVGAWKEQGQKYCGENRILERKEGNT